MLTYKYESVWLANVMVVAMTAYLLATVITLHIYLVSVVETVVHEPGDERGLSNCNDTVTEALKGTGWTFTLHKLHKSRGCVTRRDRPWWGREKKC